MSLEDVAAGRLDRGRQRSLLYIVDAVIRRCEVASVPLEWTSELLGIRDACNVDVVGEDLCDLLCRAFRDEEADVDAFARVFHACASALDPGLRDEWGAAHDLNACQICARWRQTLVHLCALLACGNHTTTSIAERLGRCHMNRL